MLYLSPWLEDDNTARSFSCLSSLRALRRSPGDRWGALSILKLAKEEIGVTQGTTTPHAHPLAETFGKEQTLPSPSSGHSRKHTHLGKTMTWPEKVREATADTRDTTMSISWGTCRGGARRWQMSSAWPPLGPGGAQGSGSRQDRSSWPPQEAGQELQPKRSWWAKGKHCCCPHVRLPRPWGEQNPHLEKSLLKALLF